MYRSTELFEAVLIEEDNIESISQWSPLDAEMLSQMVGSYVLRVIPSGMIRAILLPSDFSTMYEEVVQDDLDEEPVEEPPTP